MLDNITIIDLTQFLAGPFATQILGDLGANVVKVEWGEGDSARNIPPYMIDGDSLYYLSINRRKRSICINLKTEAGRDVLLKLVKKADVVIDNFRPGVMDRLGLDERTLRGVNPNIVLCSISGYGSDGPKANRPAYDMVVQAASGGMSMTGEPEGRPVRAGIPIGDLNAGMYSVIGILAELVTRERSNKPLKRIDVSMLDCQIAMLSYQAAYAMFSGVEPGRQGRGHRSIPTYSSFQCGDGKEIFICANTERMWQNMCHALDLNHLVEDPRFLTNSDRLKNGNELKDILNQRFAEIDSETALVRLEEADVPVSKVNGVLDALYSEQVTFRQMVLEPVRRSGKSYRMAGDPLKLAERSLTAAPALGENTDEILLEFGFTMDEINDLHEKDFIR